MCRRVSSCQRERAFASQHPGSPALCFRSFVPQSLTSSSCPAGSQLVRAVANKTNDQAGDGTTSATILTRSIFREGCKAVAAGMNPTDIRRGIEMSVKDVIAELTKMAVKVEGTERIGQVATISANGEKEVGSLIAEAMERVTKDGVITIQDGKTMSDELECVEGMKFDRGYISPYFVTDTKTQKCEFEDPAVLLVEGKISQFQQVFGILDFCAKQSKSLLVIAEDVESEALAGFIVNKLRGGLKVACVKAPGFGDNRKANMQDMAILTGAQLISEDLGLKLDKVEPSMLGTVKKASMTKDDTILLDGAGSKEAIAERCEQIRAAIDATTSDYEKEKLQERLAKLAGGVAVIKVGGSSEVEVGERKDRFVDALNATRAAVEEGIVPGGGVALLRASAVLEKLLSDTSLNEDMKVSLSLTHTHTLTHSLTLSLSLSLSGPGSVSLWWGGCACVASVLLMGYLTGHAGAERRSASRL